MTNITHFESSITNLAPLGDHFLRKQKMVSPQELTTSYEDSEEEEMYEIVKTLAAEHDVPEREEIEHPVLQSFDESISFNKAISLNQSASVATPLLVSTHKTVQQLNDHANHDLHRLLLDLESHLEGSSRLRRREDEGKISPQPKPLSDDNVASKATWLRKYVEAIWGEFVNLQVQAIQVLTEFAEKWTRSLRKARGIQASTASSIFHH